LNLYKNRIDLGKTIVNNRLIKYKIKKIERRMRDEGDG
jgi:hypothetical protein